MKDPSSSSTAEGDRFDLLIRGGTVIDPAQGVYGRRDVGILHGVIAAVAEALSAVQVARVIDAGGVLVTPGLIDLHAHVFYRVNSHSVDPSALAARSGTTTMVDCGSGGAATFDAFRHYVAAPAACRVLAFLNISLVGTIATHGGSTAAPIGADMPNVMSKFLHLGMPLEEVVRASTIRPAQAIGWGVRIGSLAVGCTADVAVFSLEEGEFPLYDSDRVPERAARRLVARHTIVAGQVLQPA
ncbi:MAG: amidohydrolase family protein [Chloroflexi bacterium]|nr:amidohydrolase family protein [Chloroflexota bacterium]